MESGDVLVASGTSCRHQLEHFTERKAMHPAVLLAELLKARRSPEIRKGNEVIDQESQLTRGDHRSG
jgi:hypothetical protein